MFETALNKWIHVFNEAMDTYGRRAGYTPVFTLTTCEQHENCVQLYFHRHDEHIDWKQADPAQTAWRLAGHSR